MTHKYSILERQLHMPTSEEQFVRYYLDKMGFKYKTEYPLNNLIGDSKTHRRVDFYLPLLNVYIEYFGMYNSTKIQRAEYDQKAKLYITNNLPSIFIYPHELGFLDYAFHTKMLRILRLKKFKKRSNILRYKFRRYVVKGKGHLFFSCIFWFYLFWIFYYYETGLTDEMNALMSIISFIVLCVFFFRFLENIFNYLYYDD